MVEARKRNWLRWKTNFATGCCRRRKLLRGKKRIMRGRGCEDEGHYIVNLAAAYESEQRDCDDGVQPRIWLFSFPRVLRIQNHTTTSAKKYFSKLQAHAHSHPSPPQPQWHPYPPKLAPSSAPANASPSAPYVPLPQRSNGARKPTWSSGSPVNTTEHPVSNPPLRTKMRTRRPRYRVLPIT